jgi:hypothetical protein
MPNYRVFRMEAIRRGNSSAGRRTSPDRKCRPKDFEPAGEVEALHE